MVNRTEIDQKLGGGKATWRRRYGGNDQDPGFFRFVCHKSTDSKDWPVSGDMEISAEVCDLLEQELSNVDPFKAILQSNFFSECLFLLIHPLTQTPCVYGTLFAAYTAPT